MTYLDELITRIEKAAIERDLADDNGFLRDLLQDAGKMLSDCARAMQWRSMDSAPNDGSDVLTARLIHGQWSIQTDYYYSEGDEDDFGWLSGTLYWMPLPGFPK
jgi:hypothetical protein